MHDLLLPWLQSVQILNTYVLQASVATRLRCGGIFNDHFLLKIFLENVSVKENSSIFGENMDKSVVPTFFDSQCTYQTGVCSQTETNIVKFLNATSILTLQRVDCWQNYYAE